ITMPGRHALHLYVVELDEDVLGITRDEAMDYLQRHGVGVGIHYYGMHLQPYYAERYALRPEQFPHATRASRRMLSLPLYPRMSDADVESVLETVRSLAAVGAGA
ncbi:MAG: DegT/DnrJ/EryC1/StrS family aminotransferase, partial [bacterium]|nr:DegT/DnrJ/EryC1/StrS family aminotransferase [bacterium]